MSILKPDIRELFLKKLVTLNPEDKFYYTRYYNTLKSICELEHKHLIKNLNSYIENKLKMFYHKGESLSFMALERIYIDMKTSDKKLIRIRRFDDIDNPVRRVTIQEVETVIMGFMDEMEIVKNKVINEIRILDPSIISGQI